MTFIPRIFRSINSKLITTENIFIEKILKIPFAASLLIYKYGKGKRKSARKVLIKNFDSNIYLEVDPSRSIGGSIYWTGFHEFREFQFLHKALREDMVFADIGANQGEYTLFAAKRLTRGRVLAFEPLPSIRQALQKNIQLNDFRNIQVFDCALANKKSSMQFHDIGGDNEGLGTLYLGDRKSKATLNIQTDTLDAIVQEAGLTRLDYIKMDIEGGELNALLGAQNTIKKFKPAILIEINEEAYSAAGYHKQDIEKFFLDFSYRAYKIEKRGYLTPYPDLPKFGNAVFIPV